MDSGGSAVWMEEGRCCFANPECCEGTESCCVVRLTRRLAGTNSECPVDLPSTVHGNVQAIRLESICNQHWMSIDFRMSVRSGGSCRVLACTSTIEVASSSPASCAEHSRLCLTDRDTTGTKFTLENANDVFPVAKRVLTSGDLVRAVRLGK